MARPKGSVNKKENNINSNLLSQPEIDLGEDFEKTEVCMSNNATIDQEALESLESEMDRVRVELQNTKNELEAKREELKNINTQVPVVVKDAAPATQVKNQGLSEKIAAQKVLDNQMVTGKFSNLRAPGQTVKLPYHKYADDPVKWWTFEHGKVYTIPRGFADQINGGDENNPCYYTPAFIKNENAIIDPTKPESGIHSVDTSNKKYMFSPINF